MVESRAKARCWEMAVIVRPVTIVRNDDVSQEGERDGTRVGYIHWIGVQHVQIKDPDNQTTSFTRSFLLPLLLFHPSSCRCGGCTGWVRTLCNGRDGRSLRLRSREGGRSNLGSGSRARRRTDVHHLLNQRAIKCLEATEEDGRMSFELQTLFATVASGGFSSQFQDAF